MRAQTGRPAAGGIQEGRSEGRQSSGKKKKGRETCTTTAYQKDLTNQI